MTLDELEEQAREAIEFGLDKPGFRVVIPCCRYGQNVAIAPGLKGKNLGHYPQNGKTVTHIWLDAHDVIKFVAKHLPSP